MKTYEHLILGTGQATGTLLGRLIPTGASIGVIEGHQVGGTCVNNGCTPTKTLVASAKVIHQAQRGDFFGFETGPVQVNFPAVMARMNKVRHESRVGLTHWMESSPNVELLRGWGTFLGPHTLAVNGQPIEAKNIYINVGTHPFTPPISGLEQVPFLDNASLLELKELPAHLLIVGGGYIGVEFAQIFRRLGAKVSLVQGGTQLMPQEDADVAQAIQTFLEEEGIQIFCSSQVEAVRPAQGQIELLVKSPAGLHPLQGSHLLLATGRRPNTARLQLEKAGIQTDARGFIVVDDFCQTNVPGVFALGDVNGQGAFTHTSVNDAEIVLDFLFGGNRRLSKRIPVYGLFTDPPLGRVGLSEKAALASGRRVLKATREMSRISRAKEMGETKGFAKLLVDADTDLILGAAILGPGGDEIINMFATIMHSGIPCRHYREVVLVHPTVSELMPWVLDGIREVMEAGA